MSSHKLLILDLVLLRTSINFGYKLHVLCGLSGVALSYDLSKANVVDLNYMKDVKPAYHDCYIYGNKGYIGTDV